MVLMILCIPATAILGYMVATAGLTHFQAFMGIGLWLYLLYRAIRPNV